MQATRPLSRSNPARAGILAVVVATAILAISAAVATIAPSLGPATGAGTTVDTPPLVLDPDARNGGGWKQPGPGVPQ